MKPIEMLLMMLTGWLNRHQQDVIEYLREKNRILREKLGKKRVILNDNQRMRLARLGKCLGRKVLADACCIFSPDTIFRTGFLAATGESLLALRLQLSRWAKAGRLVQLKKGLYVLSEPYRKVVPHPFVLANAMKKASYVSLHSALWHFGMIPEHVPTVTSVTTQRPERVETLLGRFVFRHIKKRWFCGYQQIDLVSDQTAFVATPEKALLDLVYLTHGADNYDFLVELRLQNLEKLDLGKLRELVETSGSEKLRRAERQITRLVEQDTGEDL